MTVKTRQPELSHRTLDNGTRCVIATMPDAPLTCLDIWCQAGSFSEQPGEEGLAHFLEHMVFKGSERLQAGEFDRRIEALGGSSNAATGFDDVHFHVLVPPSAATKALELLLDLVLRPALRADTFAMEREVVLEEIAQYRDQPDEQVIQTLLKGCCTDHPYGRPILGFEASLNASDPEAMRRFHHRRYQGPNCCMAIAGAIPAELAEVLSGNWLEAMDHPFGMAAPQATAAPQANDAQQATAAPQANQGARGEGSWQSPSTLEFTAGREEIRVARLESGRLLMAWLIPPASNQAMIMGADLATTLLAEGRRSRLVQHLREELQIVESIDMDVTALEQGSLVMLEACCPEDQLQRVEQEIRTLLIAGLDSPPLNQEMARARQLVRNGLCFNLEAAGQVAGLAGPQALWNRPQPLLQPLEHLNAWGADRLQQEILPLLQPDRSFTLLARPLEAS